MLPPQENCRLVPIVHLLLLRDDKILLLERVNTGNKDGYYGLIAGHKERNETVTDAIIREAKEEVGIIVKNSDLSFIHVMHRLKEQAGEKIDLFFAARNWTGKIINSEPDKHNDPAWFSLDKLPENTVPFIREVIANVHEKKYFSEFFDKDD